MNIRESKAPKPKTWKIPDGLRAKISAEDGRKPSEVGYNRGLKHPAATTAAEMDDLKVPVRKGNPGSGKRNKDAEDATWASLLSS